MDKLDFYQATMENVIPKIEKKEYKKSDPLHPGVKLRESIIPEADYNILKEETIPTLKWLFSLAGESVSGKDFDVEAFKKIFPDRRPIADIKRIRLSLRLIGIVNDAIVSVLD